jgi:MYXO-CTERM domain-containing protein
MSAHAAAANGLSEWTVRTPAIARKADVRVEAGVLAALVAAAFVLWRRRR